MNKNNSLDQLRSRYSKFTILYEKLNGDAKKIISHVSSDHSNLSWRFLGGDKKRAVERSLMEAKVFIDAYNTGCITHNARR